MWKEFIYFTRKQRIGILMLLLGILFLLVATQLSSLYKEDTPNNDLDSIIIKFETFATFHNNQNKKIITNFNPNKDSYETLIKAGLPPYFTQNIVNYRDKGGVFYKAEDLKRLYTMNDSLYHSIEAFIQIETKAKRAIKSQSKTKPIAVLKQQIEYIKQEKYELGTVVINLNNTDTTELKKIPGIGSIIAKQIIRYRERLGGFYTIKQLEEIHLDSKLLTDWFEIDTTLITKINLNSYSFKELIQHPYLSYEQVKVIENYKRKHGSITSLKYLELLEEFTTEDLQRLNQYLIFE